MPKTFEGWFLLVNFVFFSITPSIVMLFATIGFLAILLTGLEKGFDTVTASLIVLFGIFLLGELAAMEFAHSRRTLRFLWPNIIMIALTCLWILIAGVLLIGLLTKPGESTPNGYYWTLVVAALVILVTNIPRMVCHASLCLPGNRQNAWVMSERLRRI